MVGSVGNLGLSVVCYLSGSLALDPAFQLALPSQALLPAFTTSIHPSIYPLSVCVCVKVSVNRPAPPRPNDRPVEHAASVALRVDGRELLLGRLQRLDELREG